ncbi:GMDS [Branchiostoma lanceolatum]|uniref:GMDS protein n=1 Tax=Branchiostoma lanceolatum TaxID=7740 RepID=A0A8K0ACZ7_BRALA|nr:GMDS [Branchiostoma lanceolatum]
MTLGKALDTTFLTQPRFEYLTSFEEDFLQGDSTKAKKILGWEPSVSFEALVAEMVDADIELMRAHPSA